MNPFLYAITIPSTKEVVYFKEFTNKHFKVLVKTLLNKDPVSCKMFIDSLIEELAYTPLQVSSLSIADKLVIMLTIRAYNISPIVELQVKRKDGKSKIGFTINVNEIISKINQFDLSNTFEVTNSAGLTVIGALPKNLYADNILDIITNCILGVKLPAGSQWGRDGKVTGDSLHVLDFSSLDEEEKPSIVGKLPSDVFQGIYSHLSAQEERLKKVPLIDLKVDPDEVAMNETTICFSLFNNSAAEVIKLVYEVGLRGFYEAEYTLIRRFKFSPDLIDRSTPAEIGLYHTIIAEDLKREKEQMDKEQAGQRGTTIPTSR